MLGYAVVVKGGKKNKIIRHCLKVWGQLIIYKTKTDFSGFEHFGLFLHVSPTSKALSFHYSTFLLSLTSTESEANPNNNIMLYTQNHPTFLAGDLLK